MHDELTGCARKAADRITEAMFPQLREGKCDSKCDDCCAHFECKITEEITIELITEIIKECIRESVVPYQKTIECAAKYAARSGCPHCHGLWVCPRLGEVCSVSAEESEKCWMGWFAETAAKHEEAALCPEK